MYRVGRGGGGGEAEFMVTQTDTVVFVLERCEFYWGFTELHLLESC